MKYLKLYYLLFVLVLISCEKEKPIALFSVDKSTAEVDEIITFTNQSEHATSYIWDFGDHVPILVEIPSLEARF